jgi:hypothetical protein
MLPMERVGCTVISAGFVHPAVAGCTLSSIAAETRTGVCCTAAKKRGPVLPPALLHTSAALTVGVITCYVQLRSR